MDININNSFIIVMYLNAFLSRVPYLAFAQTLGLIEETSARLKIIEILSNYLRSVIVLSPNDLLASVYLCLNQLAPAYKGNLHCMEF